MLAKNVLSEFIHEETLIETNRGICYKITSLYSLKCHGHKMKSKENEVFWN